MSVRSGGGGVVRQAALPSSGRATSYVPARRLAEAAGLHRSTIYRYAARGAIPGAVHLADGSWCFDAVAAADWLVARSHDEEALCRR